ncbi:MAG: hypothetical protein ACYSUI_13695 [Planctomycetota bacterium]|jgi:hypothetical protein
MRIWIGAGVLALATASAQATVVNWDDIATDGSFTTPVPSDYLGWAWSGDVNGGGRWYTDLLAAKNAGWGGTLPEISSPNVAFNGFGDDDLWIALGGDYELKSAYLTMWPNDAGSPQVQVVGFNDGGMVYDQTFTMTNDQWLLADFGSVVVDEIHFLRTTADQSWWLMDNLTLNQVPGPMGLAVFGLACLGARRRRR